MSLIIKIFGFKSNWKKIFYIRFKLVGLILNTFLSHILNVTATEEVYNGKCQSAFTANLTILTCRRSHPVVCVGHRQPPSAPAMWGMHKLAQGLRQEELLQLGDLMLLLSLS